jgi:aminodeoxychorismate synthase component I
VLDSPVTRIAVRDVSALAAWDACVARLRAWPGFWLLDSALADRSSGRWSFAGAEPYAIARAFGDRIEVEPCRRENEESSSAFVSAWCGDPFEALRTIVPRAERSEAAEAIPFVGGAVGWLGYELAAHIERVTLQLRGDLSLPDAAWLLVDRVLAYEHASSRLFAIALGHGDEAERSADAFAERVARGPIARKQPDKTNNLTPGVASEPLRLRDVGTGLELGAFFDADSYAKTVVGIQEEIAAGELYQANLTHRLVARFSGDAWRLFEALRERSPAPFAAFVELPELTIVGSSPERFLRVDVDGAVETRPIKGTRSRGATVTDDARLFEELRSSEKERAENAMIVDLMRNDLGRVCVPGSIEVPELFAIERYATLFQMVSTVRGTLRAGRDRVDLLRAAFPPGSMTGAPKIAAMQLLARLEPVRRGVYAGALGYLDVRGGADLSVVIRTLLCRGRHAWLHVGGGIVLDSDPRAEWEETLSKARAPLDALAATQGDGEGR